MANGDHRSDNPSPTGEAASRDDCSTIGTTSLTALPLRTIHTHRGRAMAPSYDWRKNTARDLASALAEHTG